MSNGQATVYSDARPVLTLWAAVLLVGVLVAAGWQAGLASYVGAKRAESPWTYLKAAANYEAQQNWGQAIAMLHEAAKRDAQSPVPHERLGLIYYQHRSDWSAALAAFDAALARNSTSLDLRGKYIWSLIHLKRYDEAAAFGQRCIDEGQTSANFPRYTGEALFRARKFNEALPHLEKALEGFSSDMLLLERVAACLRETGNTEKLKQIEKRIRANEG